MTKDIQFRKWCTEPPPTAALDVGVVVLSSGASSQCRDRLNKEMATCAGPRVGNSVLLAFAARPARAAGPCGAQRGVVCQSPQCRVKPTISGRCFCSKLFLGSSRSPCPRKETRDWQPHPDSKSLRAIHCGSWSKNIQLPLGIIFKMFMFLEHLPCARHSKR